MAKKINRKKATPNGRTAKKTDKGTACPMTRKQFNDTAEMIKQEVVLEPKNFSTGSFGFYGNGKVAVEIDGQMVKCQLNCSLIVVGSKNAK